MRIYIVLTFIVCVVLASTVYVYLRQPIPEVVSQLVVPEPSKSNQVAPTPQTNTLPPSKTESADEKVQSDDWLSDEKSHKKADPNTGNLWNAFGSPDTETKNKKDTSNTDWIWTTYDSPEDYEKLRQQLISRFGDTPEVQAYVESWLKDVSGMTTVEDDLHYAEATYGLFPHPETLETIQLLKAFTTNDMSTFRKLTEETASSTQSTSVTDPFSDVESYFEKNDSVEGFRRLRKLDPKRALAFEKFIREKARVDPDIDLEYVENVIKRSYEEPAGNK